MKLSAKNLTLDLLMARRESSTPVRYLLISASLFGIPANNLRVTLARLCMDGLIESAGRGMYRLSPKASGLASEVGAWRHASERLRSWSGAYVTVHCGGLGRSDRAALRLRDRALQLTGFQALDRGLHVRPDNLAGGIDALRARLHALGLDPQAGIFLSTHHAMDQEVRIRRLWDSAALNARYRVLEKELKAWSKRWERLPIDEAARESYVLGGQAIRQVVFDPLLPPPLVDASARESFMQTVRDFDLLGREIWARFHAQPWTPADTEARARAALDAAEVPVASASAEAEA